MNSGQWRSPVQARAGAGDNLKDEDLIYRPVSARGLSARLVVGKSFGLSRAPKVDAYEIWADLHAPLSAPTHTSHHYILQYILYIYTLHL